MLFLLKLLLKIGAYLNSLNTDVIVSLEYVIILSGDPMDKITKMQKNISEVDSFLKENNYLNTCLKDCVDCCRDYFYASQTEFYLSLDALLKLPVNLDYFYNKAKVTFDLFNKQVNSEIKRLDPLTSNRLLTNIGNNFDEGEFINYKSLPDCIMLNNRLCSIYKSRPNTCRLYGTVNICEYLNNKDYTNDDYTNFNLYPIVANLQLVSSLGYKLNTRRYPLWFYYYYFMRPEFRPYIISNLNKLKTLSEDDYIESFNR